MLDQQTQRRVGSGAVWSRVGGVAVLAAAAGLVAGPLTPPAGPVTGTYKTLSEVQPMTPVQSLPGSAQARYVISQPGAYYLTGNIAGAAGLNGIDVTANDVTIDLSGFTIDGGGSGAVGIAAGSAAAPVMGLCVRNGTVSNWLNTGVLADGGTACVFEDLRIRLPGQRGLVTGPGSVVRGCAFYAGYSAVVASGTEIVDCSATATDVSYRLLEGCSATRCASYNAGTAGFLVTGHNCSIVDCVTRGGAEGIELASGGNRVERCKIGSTPMGIRSYDQTGGHCNTIVDNTVNSATAGQGYGISMVFGNNLVQGNHIYAFEQGIVIYQSSTTNVVYGNTIHACTIPMNPLNGFGTPMAEPTVNTAAGLAANPVGNIVQ